jgi:hypothetical protein
VVAGVSLTDPLPLDFPVRRIDKMVDNELVVLFFLRKRFLQDLVAGRRRDWMLGGSVDYGEQPLAEMGI